MDRKKFLKSGLASIGAIVGVPTVLTSCSKNKTVKSKIDSCDISPSETKGPFPNLTPAQLVRASIIGDRTGVAMLMTLTILDQSENCKPLEGALIDVWHCDKDGYYSQYGGTRMQQENFTQENFLRGRQTTDKQGKVSFISIFPGWYRGRAPHIHFEVLSSSGNSLLVGQIAFPDSVYETVYATTGYRGTADTSNERDSIFADSLNGNMADSVVGNVTDGYTLLKTIIVA